MWKRSEREKQQRVDTRRRVAQKLGPTARVILSQTQAFGDGGYSLKRWGAGSGNRSRCHDAVIFVCTHETSHVGTNMARRVLNSFTQEKVHLTIPRRAAGRLNYGSRLNVGLPPTKLLLRLTEQLLHVQQMVFVEVTFPSKAYSVLCKYKHVYYVTNCSTEVGEHPILFFSVLCEREQ